ncbi:hypothetical protein EJA71_24065 [Pseudomonas sp. PB106]|nr:hypothetical protein EJA71_24065 [Pseudomonas sp. PB106]
MLINNGDGLYTKTTFTIGSMCTTKTCGSWLASDEAGPGNIVLPDPPPSLASQLPQVLCCIDCHPLHRSHCTGRKFRNNKLCA